MYPPLASTIPLPYVCRYLLYLLTCKMCVGRWRRLEGLRRRCCQQSVPACVRSLVSGKCIYLACLACGDEHKIREFFLFFFSRNSVL